MSLINDLIYFDNPSIWHDFGGTSGGFAGITWQMMIWSIIVGLLVFVWLIYNIIMFKHKDGDPEPKDALKAGVFPHERGNVTIELTWTIAPLILVTWLTYISLAPLDYLWDVPEEDETDLVIEVTAAQWFWTFNYEDDYVKPSNFNACPSNIGCLEIPHGMIIRFNINAQDVHCHY